MARAKRPGERRTYPWRAALTDVACSGTRGDPDPHLPVLYAELEQRDPQAAPYEWTCGRCGVTAPSSWWDERVPVPPHEFIAEGKTIFHVAENWQCRVCLQPSENRMFHPAPAAGPFDPSRLVNAPVIEALGEWSLVLDDSLGSMEAYVAHDLKVIAVSSETWQIVDGSDEAYGRLLGEEGRSWRASASGMRFLAGVPAFDKAVRIYRAERGEDVVQAKDEITQLSELLTSLAAQAVSIGADGDEEQRQILMGRYMSARTRVQELRERLNGLDGQLDIVAMGVMVFG